MDVRGDNPSDNSNASTSPPRNPSDMPEREDEGSYCGSFVSSTRRKRRRSRPPDMLGSESRELLDTMALIYEEHVRAAKVVQRVFRRRVVWDGFVVL